MFKDKTILVTGGTGSWGHELVSQLLEKCPKEIRIFSRSESSQFAMKQEFNNNPLLHFIIGDIKERQELTEACRGADYVFHLAALKHVPVCEEQPLEALKTNVHGTQNVIDAAIVNKVKSVIYISTDKAANPSNFYGLSKSMGERLIIHANTLKTSTKFVCIRGGNVLGTNGSVVHIFKKQIQEKGQIGITDINMTRFFLTLKDAIKLVFKAVEDSIGGEIFVMKMQACKIVDLAYVLAEEAGKQDVEIEVIGLRPGEKIHECLISEYEAGSTITYDKAYYVILPSFHIPELKEAYATFKPVEIESYSSSERLMNRLEIKEILKQGGFIQ
ncbi:polysaccharide biosynthesis protein [Bacillus infantis]|uniref:polysaccharide biosynthesis protein n=1 Tax=Bacillus infantis TaxID=324767 RepID=UPI00209F61AA|nr:polysaccharide biosynthesis protein [Bacillus infantis]